MERMSRWVQRYFFFVLGLVINAFGIAFITKSAMGTSQISSVPYVMSLHWSRLSFGGFSFLVNMVFIVLQMVVLRKEFHPIQFLQIGVNVIFSVCIDVGMASLSWLVPGSLAARIGCLAIGCTILAFGICVEVAPNVVFVPGEGAVRALAVASGQDFGRMKLCFDMTLIGIAAVLSLVFFHGLVGVGLGTVASAFLVGPMVSVINRRVGLIGYIRRLV